MHPTETPFMNNWRKDAPWNHANEGPTESAFILQIAREMVTLGEVGQLTPLAIVRHLKEKYTITRKGKYHDPNT